MKEHKYFLKTGNEHFLPFLEFLFEESAFFTVLQAFCCGWRQLHKSLRKKEVAHLCTHLRLRANVLDGDETSFFLLTHEHL